MDIRIKFEKIFRNITGNEQIFEAVLHIESGNGQLSECYSYGGRGIRSPFLMASVTKLFTTVCILTLIENKKLSLDNPITDFFNKDLLNGLHICKGEDYSHKLTVSDLLFQTSGLPDWFEEGGGKMMAVEKDFFYTFDDMLENSKELKPHFPPRAPDKSFYADINFDLLGAIIEKVAQAPLESVYKEFIINPLGLSNTYLPMSDDDYVPYMYYKYEVLRRPAVIMSCRASGGCVTTAHELMLFLKAFFCGSLFSKEMLQKLSVYRPLQLNMWPIQYGGGFMRIGLNSLNTLFMGKGELLGHSGSTGSFAFFLPHSDLFFVGDLNQMADPTLPIKLVMKLAMAVG